MRVPQLPFPGGTRVLGSLPGQFLILGLFALLAFSSCAKPSSHSFLVKRGQNAEKQREWLKAAQLYQQACDLKPSETTYCTRARAMTDYAVEIRAYHSRTQCTSGDLKLCLGTIEPVRRVQSKNSHLVTQVIEQAATLALKQCVQPNAQKLSARLSELQCLQSWHGKLSISAMFREAFVERSQGIAGEFVAKAARAPRTSLAAKASYLQAASCLAPLSGQDRQALARFNREFIQSAGTPLFLQYSAGGGPPSRAPGTCLAIANEIGRGLNCDNFGQQQSIQVKADVLNMSPRWQKTHSDQQKVARYQAGTQTQRNPNYEHAQTEYELANDRWLEAQRFSREQEQACGHSQDKADCKIYKAAVSRQEDRRVELERARRRYNNEPTSTQRKVYQEHSYVVRTHRWTAPYRSTIRLGDNAPIGETTEIVYKDKEQAGFARAGVAADGFSPPETTYFRDEGARWLTQRIVASVQDELRSRAHAINDTCKGDSTNCWALANYWLGNTELGALLAGQLANTTDAKSTKFQCTASLL